MDRPIGKLNLVLQRRNGIKTMFSAEWPNACLGMSIANSAIRLDIISKNEHFKDFLLFFACV